MKWQHVRKGIIEGEIVQDDGVFVVIELTNKVRMGYGDPLLGQGFRSVHAGPGQAIRVRKSFLRPLPKESQCSD